MKNVLLFIWEVGKIIIIALLIVIPIRYFIFQPFIVRGASMEPNFQCGDYLIVDQLSYRFREPKRGEVVIFSYPRNLVRRYIKRIIGLPGEVVEIRGGQVIIFYQQEKKVLDESDYLALNIQTTGEGRTYLNKNEFFVLGDNRTFSADSRHWGPLPKEDIIGRVFLRAWPLTALSKFEAPSY